MTTTHLQADAAQPVTYGDGRLSNGIVAVLFGEEGSFSISDARTLSGTARVIGGEPFKVVIARNGARRLLPR